MTPEFALERPAGQPAKRRGSSAVEFAVVAPLLLLFLFGALELGRAVMVQHMLQEAAQAGCRLYAVSDATQADATAIIDQAMQQGGVDNYTIEFEPDSKGEIDEPLQAVSVVVRAQYEDIGWIAPFFMDGAVVAGRCTMPADMSDDAGADDDGGSTTEDNKSNTKKKKSDDDDD